MKKILVTGGCGYIGSHTIVDLVENGFEVISVDNNSRSTPRILEGIEKITGKKIKNYKVDLCNYDDTFAIFQENRYLTSGFYYGLVLIAVAVILQMVRVRFSESRMATD